jgi:hypothetical protein
MRRVAWGVLGASVGFCCLSARAADTPVIVIPGKPGVPVIINGVDASYAVVEGDWGLDRPGHVPPTIITPPLLSGVPLRDSGYFPALGRRPGYGRLEIEPPPNRRKPPRAPSFRRGWSAASEPAPASKEQPDDRPQVNVEVNVGPRSARARPPRN